MKLKQDASRRLPSRVESLKEGIVAVPASFRYLLPIRYHNRYLLHPLGELYDWFLSLFLLSEDLLSYILHTLSDIAS